MRKFTDRTGQDWIVEINYGVAKRCHAYDIDLFNEEQVDKIINGPGNMMRLINLLYITCEEQVNQRGISDVEFGNLLTGTGDAGADAIIGALHDFFMDIGRNPALAEVIKRTWELAGQKQEKARQLAVDLVSGEKMSLAMDQVLEKAKQKAEREIDQLLSGEKD